MIPGAARFTSAGFTSSSALLNAKQFDVEDQRRVGRDRARRAARTVAEIGRDRQGALAADLHAGDALVPALDHLVRPEAERERLAAIDRAVEFFALGAVLVEPAGIMD